MTEAHFIELIFFIIGTNMLAYANNLTKLPDEKLAGKSTQFIFCITFGILIIFVVMGFFTGQITIVPAK